MSNSNHERTLLELPPELLMNILGWLTAVDLVTTARTCRQLLAHSSNERLWQDLVNGNLPQPLLEPTPLKSFRDLYVAHHPNWFLPGHRIWFADSQPSGKLLFSKFDVQKACIVAHAVTAQRGRDTRESWEKDPEVLIQSFNPKVSLDLNQPVLKLETDSRRAEEHSHSIWTGEQAGPPSIYSKEVLMQPFPYPGMHASLMLCRSLPEAALGDGTLVWPPQRFPTNARTRNDTRDGYRSFGHRPNKFSEVSQANFRLRRWVEFTGRAAEPDQISSSTLNQLSAALGAVGPSFTSSVSASSTDRMTFRMQQDITTYASLPSVVYTPTKQKPWQGIWCGDYSGHGSQFLLITQPDRRDEKPLPSGMEWMTSLFPRSNRDSTSSESDYARAPEETGTDEVTRQQTDEVTRQQTDEVTRQQTDGVEDSIVEGNTSSAPQLQRRRDATVDEDPPTRRLEAIKLTGDPNIPRGEYTFLAPDIGDEGLLRVADEEIFRGARIVRSAGHIAEQGFKEVSERRKATEIDSITTDHQSPCHDGRPRGFVLPVTPRDGREAEERREYYPKPEAQCTTWSYFTPVAAPASTAAGPSTPVIGGLEIYTAKSALQAQVDDPVYFQAYHATVKKEGLYSKPEDLVAWYQTGGFLARGAKAEPFGNVLISVTRLEAKDGGMDAVLGFMKPFAEWVRTNEPDVLTYAIFTRRKAPNEIMCFVRYKNGKALRAHDSCPEHKDVSRKLAGATKRNGGTTTVWREIEGSFVSTIVGGGVTPATSSKL